MRRVIDLGSNVIRQKNLNLSDLVFLARSREVQQPWENCGAMKPDIDKLAKQHGFEVEREKKHTVYKGPEGETLVTPSTPSDQNWEQNALTTLAKLVDKPRKDLLHVDHKPLRALRPHTPLPKHDNPAALDKKTEAKLDKWFSSIAKHMNRALSSRMFLHSYASTAEEESFANADAVLQLARNLRRDGLDCDAVFCMRIGGEGEGYVCAEVRLDGGALVCYLDLNYSEIRQQVPWTLEDGRSYEPVAYAGDWS